MSTCKDCLVDHIECSWREKGRYPVFHIRDNKWKKFGKRHKTVLVNSVEIDRNIAELIKLLWDNGYKTRFSCEDSLTADVRPGNIQIAFTTKSDALRFIEVLYVAIAGFVNDSTVTKIAVTLSINCDGNYFVYFPRKYKRQVIAVIKGSVR
jgi:hypothetical protein